MYSAAVLVNQSVATYLHTLHLECLRQLSHQRALCVLLQFPEPIQVQRDIQVSDARHTEPVRCAAKQVHGPIGELV